jgi:hypothetical protein
LPTATTLLAVAQQTQAQDVTVTIETGKPGESVAMLALDP